MLRLKSGMSTTRPLLGMRRVTELTLSEQPGARLPASAGRQPPEAATTNTTNTTSITTTTAAAAAAAATTTALASGSVSASAATVDEFTVPEVKEEELKCAKPRVELVFKVKFTIIGLLDHTGQAHGSKTSRQIWLQLRGNREDVSKAKVSLSGCFFLKRTTAVHAVVVVNVVVVVLPPCCAGEDHSKQACCWTYGRIKTRLVYSLIEYYCEILGLTKYS